jgi:hypothetical protein
MSPPHPLTPSDSSLPFQLFRVHHKTGVEQAGALDCGAANQSRRADQPVDLLRSVLGRVSAAVAPRPGVVRPALFQRRAFPEVDTFGGEAAARRLHAAIGVAQLRPDHRDIGVLFQIARQRRDCIADDLGIRVEQENVIKF